MSAKSLIRLMIHHFKFVNLPNDLEMFLCKIYFLVNCQKNKPTCVVSLCLVVYLLIVHTLFNGSSTFILSHFT